MTKIAVKAGELTHWMEQMSLSISTSVCVGYVKLVATDSPPCQAGFKHGMTLQKLNDADFSMVNLKHFEARDKAYTVFLTEPTQVNRATNMEAF